jgi:hypothetical protein
VISEIKIIFKKRIVCFAFWFTMENSNIVLIGVSMKKIITVLLVLMVTTGTVSSCMHTRVRMADTTPDYEASYTKWFFFGGLLPHRKYEVNDLCPGGSVVEVDQYTKGWQVLTAIPFAIFTPQTLHVKCSKTK